MRFNADIQVEEIENCLLCGEKGVPLYREMHDQLSNAPGKWSFYSCSACALIWLNTSPTFDDIGKVYTTTYCTHTLNEQKPILDTLRGKIEHAILMTNFGYNCANVKRGLKWIGKVFSLIVPFKEIVGSNVMWLNGRFRGKLLDVGCGGGRFLAKMRELGWDVVGVEPDQIAAEIAREYFNIPVKPGRLEEIDIPANSFQAVTARHVIEHVHNPVRLLQECYRLLAPGGVLVILTPNADSLGHKIFKRNWSELDPPRHLYLFSPKTLTNAAKLAGLPSSVRIRSTARAARWTWAPSVAIRYTGRSDNKAGLVGAARFVFWAIEEALSIFAGSHCGEELILIARKDGSMDDL